MAQWGSVVANDGFLLFANYRYCEVYNEAASLGEYLQDNHVAYAGKLSKEECKAVEQEVDQHLYRSAKAVASWILKNYSTTRGAVMDERR